MTCELQRVLHFVKVVTKAWSVVMILGRYFCEWTYFYVAVPFMRPDPVSTWGFSALTLSWKDNAASRPFLPLDRLAVNRRRGISSHFCFYLTNSDPSSTLSPFQFQVREQPGSPLSVAHRLAKEQRRFLER